MSGSPGFELQIDDEIGHHDLGFPVDPQHQVLVLDGDFGLGPGPVVDAAENGFATGEAALQFAMDVSDLAGKEQRTAGCLQHVLDNIAALGAGFEHRASDVEGQAERAGNRRLANEIHAHRCRGETGPGAHVDRDLAGEAFEFEHVGHVPEHHDIALLVGDGRRFDRCTVDHVGRHLEFGEGTSHAVAIEHRQASLRRRQNRLHSVGPADLGRDQRRDRVARGFLGTAQGAQAFLALFDLFDANHRRADAADFADKGVIRQCVERQHLNRGTLAHQLAGAQHADIGVATATRSEQCGADRKRQQVRFREWIARRHEHPPATDHRRP